MEMKKEEYVIGGVTNVTRIRDKIARIEKILLEPIQGIEREEYTRTTEAIMILYKMKTEIIEGLEGKGLNVSIILHKGGNISVGLIKQEIGGKKNETM